MSNKTYWGLNEIELNQFWKSIPAHKETKYTYLTLEEEYKEPYEYYLEKVKIIEPDFIEEMLINTHIDIIDFRDNSEFTEYAEYKAFHNIPTPEQLEKLALEQKLLQEAEHKKIMDDLMEQKKALDALIYEKLTITS